MCLSSAELRAILGIKFTAQTAGTRSRHCRNRKQIGGGVGAKGLEGGPVPKRPVMGIIGHHQLLRSPHRTVVTEIRSQTQQQLRRTAPGGQGSAGGFCNAHGAPWRCALSRMSGRRARSRARPLIFSCPSSNPEAASEPPGLAEWDLEPETAPPGASVFLPINRDDAAISPGCYVEWLKSQK